MDVDVSKLGRLGVRGLQSRPGLADNTASRTCLKQITLDSIILLKGTSRHGWSDEPIVHRRIEPYCTLSLCLSVCLAFCVTFTLAALLLISGSEVGAKGLRKIEANYQVAAKECNHARQGGSRKCKRWKNTKGRPGTVPSKDQGWLQAAAARTHPCVDRC